jgi:hypothetical protein
MIALLAWHTLLLAWRTLLLAWRTLLLASHSRLLLALHSRTSMAPPQQPLQPQGLRQALALVRSSLLSSSLASWILPLLHRHHHMLQGSKKSMRPRATTARSA